MKKYLVSFIILLLASWAAAIFWLLPSVEKEVENGARSVLASEKEAFANVTVTAVGQAIKLTGSVATEEEKSRAAILVGSQTKAPLSWRFGLGADLSPHTEVINEITVAGPVVPVAPPVPVPPKPPGWALLSVKGRAATLIGETANAEEQAALVAAVKEKWSDQTNVDQFQLSQARGKASNELHLTSLAALPQPPATLGSLAYAQLGQDWQLVADLKMPETGIQQLLGQVGIPWQTVAGTVADLRAFHDAAWAKLGSPYLTLSAQGNRIEIRGAVATEDIKQLILGDAEKFYEGREVKSDIKLADAMRADIDPSPTLAEWPEVSPTDPTGIIAFAPLGKAWRRISARSTSGQWQQLMPEGFTAAPALADLAALSESLKTHLKMAPPPANVTAPYVALSALGSKVDIKGEVASDDVKTFLSAEFARVFAGKFLTMDLRVSNRVASITDITQTMETIPAPPSDKGSGLMAFAPIGRPWRLLSADPAMGEQPRAPWVGLVESGFDTTLAEDDLTELAKHFHKAGGPESSQADLPLPHLSLAIYNGGVHMSGEVSSMDEKRAILAAAKLKWPDVDRHDEIRPTAAVQPGSKWAENVAKAPDLPEAPSSVLALLVSGKPWSELFIKAPPVAEDSLPTSTLFPGELERTLALGDFFTWVREINEAAEPSSKPVATPRLANATATEFPYVDLLAIDHTLIVEGEVAEEETKSAILDALVNRWDGWTIKDGINVTQNVKPSEDLDVTLQSLLDPPAGKERFAAAAKIGMKLRKDVVHSVYLASNTSTVSRDQQIALQRMKFILKAIPDTSFRVVGNTDSEGNKKKNEALSQQRAQLVSKYLSANGIPGARLKTSGVGSEDPIASNETPEGRVKNRRVDILLK